MISYSGQKKKTTVLFICSDIIFLWHRALYVNELGCLRNSGLLFLYLNFFPFFFLNTNLLLSPHLSTNWGKRLPNKVLQNRLHRKCRDSNYRPSDVPTCLSRYFTQIWHSFTCNRLYFCFKKKVLFVVFFSVITLLKILTFLPLWR